MTTPNLLYLTAGTVGFALMICAYLLVRRGQFHWKSSGFWAWTAFALYFVVNPFFVALSGINLDTYKVRLAIAGGASRGEWILFVILIGITVFFLAYLRGAEPQSIQLQPPKDSREIKISLFGLVILLLFLGFGFYSLIQYRTFAAEQEVLIVGGRFVGDVTGYQNNGYNFLFFPTALLLLSQRKISRLMGWGLAALFLVLSLPNGWSRFTLVSMLILVSVASVITERRRWPRLIWLLALILLAATLQVRGHVTWTYKETPNLIDQTVGQAVQNTSNILASKDTAMLATFYLESHLFDSITGFRYGLPLLNYALTGWIPYRFFPQKYFIVDWLSSRQGDVPQIVEQLLYGAKSSLLGDLYGNGWLIGVVLGMWILGVLNYRLDKMLALGDPIKRAIALAILSQAWMIWGSNLTWGLVRLGFILMPAFGVWLTIRRPTRYANYSNTAFQKRLET